jgi:hypothetical protein
MAGSVSKGLDVLRLDERQLIVSGPSILRLRVPIPAKPDIRKRFNLGKTEHRRAMLGSYKDVFNRAHVAA